LADFAQLWQAADKVVYSRTLDKVWTARTALEREFDPKAIRELKARASKDILIGGPELASAAFKAGLIDECQLVVAPVAIGGGKSCMPEGMRLQLELAEH